MSDGHSTVIIDLRDYDAPLGEVVDDGAVYEVLAPSKAMLDKRNAALERLRAADDSDMQAITAALSDAIRATVPKLPAARLKEYSTTMLDTLLGGILEAEKQRVIALGLEQKKRISGAGSSTESTSCTSASSS